jgi:hypothetical protein
MVVAWSPRTPMLALERLHIVDPILWEVPDPWCVLRFPFFPNMGCRGRCFSNMLSSFMFPCRDKYSFIQPIFFAFSKKFQPQIGESNNVFCYFISYLFICPDVVTMPQ